MNLSDKDLDRLSREAAKQHDPGDLVGPRSWDRLEFRLDKELGKLSPSPVRGIRGIRRIPFYFAPAIILLVGVSYYAVKHNKGMTAKAEPSGSPPLSALKTLSPEHNGSDSTTKTLTNSSNSTRPDNNNTVQYPIATPITAPSSVPDGEPVSAGETDVPGSTRASSSSSPSSGHSHTNLRPHPHSLPESPATPAEATGADHSLPSTGDRASGTFHKSRRRLPGSRYHNPGNNAGQNAEAANKNRDQESASTGWISGENASPVSDRIAGENASGSHPVSQRTADFTRIQHPRSLTRFAGVDDAGLRALASKKAPVATPIRLGKKKEAALHVERPLSIGFSLSPDFASVHSMAGDRPGSSIGLTLDYEILHRLHIGTGLLLTRKNYAASPDNYHVPKDYYRINNPSAHDISLVKGSFYMMEVPLNLRYDFSVSGNTIFFLSGGVSSYLLTSEHSQYYFDYFGRQTCLNFNPRLEPTSKNYLFASMDLSAGVETGISNSLSLLIAPYVKLPTRGMGFGQVQLTSVGINFALKFTPVLGRSRK